MSPYTIKHEPILDVYYVLVTVGDKKVVLRTCNTHEEALAERSYMLDQRLELVPKEDEE